VWHRRAGKDDVCLHWSAVSSFQRVGNYWHMLPEAAQARKAIWDAVNPHTGKRRIDEAFPEAVRETTREQDMLIRFKSGSSWQVVGSDNYNSLVGSAPVGIVFSEWALADPAAWAYLRPILAENGGWALFIYTSRGRNHGHTTFDMAKADPNWYAERLTVEDTGALPPHIVEQERREYVSLYGEEAGNALFEQEYLCSFDAAILGAYYGSEILRAEQQGRIGKVDYDPTLPVSTAWDLGFTDDTAIWFFQVAHGEVRIIDYYASHGKSIEHYCDVLKAKPYKYGRHWVPHDAQAKSLVSAGKTVIEQAKARGLSLWLVKKNTVQAGVQAARAMWPRCWFDAEKCKDGIEALRHYRREWDDAKKCFTDNPVHDWTSHPADAFRYLAWVWREPPVAIEPAAPKVIVVGGPSTLTIDEAWASSPRAGGRI